MVLSSMHAINDVGSQHLCENPADGQEDIAHYVSLHANLTHLPASLISGLCLPKECSSEVIHDFGFKLQTNINEGLIKF